MFAVRLRKEKLIFEASTVGSQGRLFFPQSSYKSELNTLERRNPNIQNRENTEIGTFTSSDFSHSKMSEIRTFSFRFWTAKG